MIGFAGALLLVLFKPEGGMVKAEIHGLFLVLATFLYGINVNLIKYKLHHYNAWTVASLPIFFMLPFMILVLIITGFFQINLLENRQTILSLGAISLLGIVGTAISLVLFNKLIQLTNAVFASSVTYLIPVFALMWGILDGESTGIYQIAGLLLILTGIAVIRRKS